MTVQDERGRDGRGRTAGIVLAAGAGRRYGRPKILVADWLDRAANALRLGGCDDVYVVTGAARPTTLPDGVQEVQCTDWESGMGSSLACGLSALDGVPERVVLHLVDCPDVGPDVVQRLLKAAGDSLARAVFEGRPGHPVLVPSRHLVPLARSLVPEQGASGYLRGQRVVQVECGDLATGMDRDVP